jgi:predicted transposase/invertase (TIGR01784 family)
VTRQTPAPEPIRLHHPIDPTVDCVFKALFGQEENKDLLIHFLNAILKPEAPITDITYINPINDPRTEDEKLTIIDIRAVDTAGTNHHIEMQLRNHRALPERMLYNWSSIYQRLISSGQDFDQLTPVISIWLLGFNLLDNPAHHHHFQVRDVAHGARLSDHLHIHTLELKKWRPASDSSSEDTWLHFFRDAKQWQELPPDLSAQPQMRHAMSILKHFSDDEKARYAYERRMMLLSLQTTIDNENRDNKAQAEVAQQQAEAARQQAEAARQQAEAAQQQAEAAQQQAEAAQQQAEAAQQQAEAAQQQAEAARQQAKTAHARAEQESARAEQESARAEQESARAEQESTRAEQESTRAEQESAARVEAERRLQGAQQRQQQQRQTLRQSLVDIYTKRFNAALPQALSAALDDATLDQLAAWIPVWISAAASEVIAAATQRP